MISTVILIVLLCLLFPLLIYTEIKKERRMKDLINITDELRKCKDKHDMIKRNKK